MRWNILLAFTYVLQTSAPSFSAESTSQALKSFGLIGTWSEDCSNPKALRMTFGNPIFGNPTIKMEAHNDKHGSGTIEVELISASRVTEEKLLTSSVFTAKDGVKAPTPPPPPSKTVFEKIGTKMKSGEMVLEKCLN